MWWQGIGRAELGVAGVVEDVGMGCGRRCKG